MPTAITTASFLTATTLDPTREDVAASVRPPSFVPRPPASRSRALADLRLPPYLAPSLPQIAKWGDAASSTWLETRHALWKAPGHSADTPAVQGYLERGDWGEPARSSVASARCSVADCFLARLPRQPSPGVTPSSLSATSGAASRSCAAGSRSSPARARCPSTAASRRACSSRPARSRRLAPADLIRSSLRALVVSARSRPSSSGAR